MLPSNILFCNKFCFSMFYYNLLTQDIMSLLRLGIYFILTCYYELQAYNNEILSW